MRLRLEVKQYHEFFWLRDIEDVNIYECCAKCFIGGKDNRVYYGTLHQQTALIDIEVLENPDAKAYYLCGLSAGFEYRKNVHVAFVPDPDSNIELENSRVKIQIFGARQILFSKFTPSPTGYFSEHQRTCRNWIFANYLKEDMPL